MRGKEIIKATLIFAVIVASVAFITGTFTTSVSAAPSYDGKITTLVGVVKDIDYKVTYHLYVGYVIWTQIKIDGGPVLLFNTQVDGILVGQKYDIQYGPINTVRSIMKVAE